MRTCADCDREGRKSRAPIRPSFRPWSQVNEVILHLSTHGTPDLTCDLCEVVRALKTAEEVAIITHD